MQVALDTSIRQMHNANAALLENSYDLLINNSPSWHQISIYLIERGPSIWYKDVWATNGPHSRFNGSELNTYVLPEHYNSDLCNTTLFYRPFELKVFCVPHFRQPVGWLTMSRGWGMNTHTRYIHADTHTQMLDSWQEEEALHSKTEKKNISLNHMSQASPLRVQNFTLG